MADGTDDIAIIYYQGWAEGANYAIKTRRACTSETTEIVCAITVSDDFGRAMGYEATDTFRLTVVGDKVTAVTFAGDDPPIFQELFQWIGSERPEVLTGPCLNMFTGGTTPGVCSAAVAQSAVDFMAQRGEK